MIIVNKTKMGQYSGRERRMEEEEEATLESLESDDLMKEKREILREHDEIMDSIDRRMDEIGRATTSEELDNVRRDFRTIHAQAEYKSMIQYKKRMEMLEVDEMVEDGHDMLTKKEEKRENTQRDLRMEVEKEPMHLREYESLARQRRKDKAFQQYPAKVWKSKRGKYYHKESTCTYCVPKTTQLQMFDRDDVKIKTCFPCPRCQLEGTYRF
jgi:hypothetical protein